MKKTFWYSPKEKPFEISGLAGLKKKEFTDAFLKNGITKFQIALINLQTAPLEFV